MSDLSRLKDAILKRSLPDAFAAIRKAITDIKALLAGDPVQTAATATTVKIEDVKNTVEAAVSTYLVGKFGPEYGVLASGVADTALNALVNTIEGILTSAAAPPTE